MSRPFAIVAALLVVACSSHDEKRAGFNGPGFGQPGTGGGAVTIPGGTCAAGKTVTAVSSAGLATCASTNINDYAGTHLEWVDEYMYNQSVAANGTLIGSVWTTFVSGTGAVIAGTGTTTRPGLATINTGTTTTGFAALEVGNSTVDFGSGNWSFEWTGGFPTLSTAVEEYTAVIGFADNGTAVANFVDGCYFLYDRGNVATSGTNTGNADKLSCWCVANSVRTASVFLMDGVTASDGPFTTVNAPVAAMTLPNTNIMTLKVSLTLGTQADFYVNGIKSCQITHNVPSGSTRVLGVKQNILKSAGITSRAMQVDRSRLAVDLTSARSP